MLFYILEIKMNTKPGIKVIIKTPEIEVARVIENPFNQGIEELTQNGYKLISTADDMRFRVQQGRDHIVSRSGNYVREAPIYFPNQPSRIVRVSPLVKYPELAKLATQAHRDRK